MLREWQPNLWMMLITRVGHPWTKRHLSLSPVKKKRPAKTITGRGCGHGFWGRMTSKCRSVGPWWDNGLSLIGSRFQQHLPLTHTLRSNVPTPRGGPSQKPSNVYSYPTIGIFLDYPLLWYTCANIPDTEQFCKSKKSQRFSRYFTSWYKVHKTMFFTTNHLLA